MSKEKDDSTIENNEDNPTSKFRSAVGAVTGSVGSAMRSLGRAIGGAATGAVDVVIINSLRVALIGFLIMLLTWIVAFIGVVLFCLGITLALVGTLVGLIILPFRRGSSKQREQK